jgi:hypothetical protein
LIRKTTKREEKEKKKPKKRKRKAGDGRKKRDIEKVFTPMLKAPPKSLMITQGHGSRE